jgi:hypothetical protein
MPAKLPDWADPENKKMVAKVIDPEKWALFLGGVENGNTVAQSLKSAGISRRRFNGAMRTEPKAREQYEEARIAAVWKTWDYEVVEEIMIALMTCEQGGHLNRILEDRGLNSASFYYLMNRDPAVKDMYEEARQVQAEIMADKLQSIADDGVNDTYTDDNGRVRIDQDVVQRSRLRVDTMKWRLSKLHHKRFGDKIQQEQNINMVVDHAERLEAARKRKDKLFSQRTRKK